MSGLTPLVDTLLATRLAQRVDLVPLKGALEIAGPEAVTDVEAVSNDIRLPSRAALQQQLGVGLSYRGDGGKLPPSASPGGAVTLSAAARAVTAILDLPSGAKAGIRGAEPLLPSSPLLPPVHLLAARLTQTVASSGLFYESHLQQYAAGQRTLAQLVQEPQARLDAAEKTSPALPAAGLASQAMVPGALDRAVPDLAAALLDVAPLAADVGADAGADSLASGRSGSAAAADLPGGTDAGAPAPAMPAPVDLAVRANPVDLAASYGSAAVRDRAHGAFHDVVGQVAGAEKPVAVSRDTVATLDSVAVAIHPDALALVRQQLELLAVPVFRWAGEAWPGATMDWEIHEQQQEERPAGEDPGAPPTWITRVAVNLPRLGAVQVRLSLAGAALQVHLAASESATLALLGQGGSALTQRFDALGLQLTGLQIGALAPGPARQDAGKNDDAATSAR